ncbi:MAG: glycosyl hydrolase [Eubacteriales bacterium]|nr:glycosyl hydrolase [Eubacteriales bacterium]
MKKRNASIMALLLSLALAAQPVTSVLGAENGESSFASALEERYTDPDRIYSSDVRWWLGSASATDETLLEEIQTLYDSGFRGVELCMQDDGVAPDEDYSYGSEMWSHKWKLMMNKLLDLGMSVYLTSGTNWASANVPKSKLDPTSEAAMQILASSYEPIYCESGEKLEGTAIGTPETYSIPWGEEEGTFVSCVRDNTQLRFVYAYEIDENGKIVSDAEPIDLMAEEKIIKGEGETNYTINWEVPGEGKKYMIYPIYSQGSYEVSTPATEECYTINYFDEAGVEALKTFWSEHYLDDPELNEKIKNGDVQLFMDSLEIKYGNESEGITWWTEDIIEEFQKRKGYDITPYYVLIEGVGSGFTLATNLHSQCVGKYDLTDETLRKKIIQDYQDVMTQIYEENMLIPLKEWLNSCGITTRAQISYGKALEITEPSQYVDYPEAENLNQYNQPDLFRLHTAGAKLLNKVLSTETGGTSAVYGTSWQELLDDIYVQYATGFQRVIWHIWTAGYGYGNYNWPGYMSGFGGGTAFNRWGSREPASRDYDEFNAHIGRVQEFVQEGKSRTDVGFVYNNWTQGMKSGGEDGSFTENSMNQKLAHQGIIYRSTELQDNGYTYDYFSPDFLFNEDVYYDKETGTIEGAGYRALVIFQEMLDYDAAVKILELAKEGLPVVIVGSKAATATTFNDGKDKDLAKVMEEMKSLENVRAAAILDNEVAIDADETGNLFDEVYTKLHDELGIRPYAEFAEPNLQLLTNTREDEEGNRYLYVYNYCDGTYHEHSKKEGIAENDHGTNIQTEIKMEGTYVPYSLDAWTGEVTELGEFRYENGQTIIPIDLDYSNIALFVFEKVEEQPLSITETNAESAYITDDGINIRATETGTYKTVFSDGESREDEINVPEAYDITNWDLTVESWTGTKDEDGNDAGDLVRTETIDGLETVNRKTSTTVTDIQVNLDTLKTWDQIEEVGDKVSGLGHYEATFNWDPSQATGAYIDFGSVHQSMEVWINGTKVGGEISTNPTKVKKGLDVEISDGKGGTILLDGKDEYTGGVNLKEPIFDATEYLVEGENSIVIEYSSDLTNVMLAEGKISPSSFGVGEGRSKGTWWGKDVDVRSYGPTQAKVIPYVEVQVK